MDNKYKMMIPKYLTIFRIIVVPLILLTSILKWYIPSIIFIILGILTNILDHVLNQTWKVGSKSRTKLDLIANKIFYIGISLFLAFHYHLFFLVLLLEILLSGINIYFYSKKNKMEILKIGKWKDIIFSITILAYFLLLLSCGKENICHGLLFTLINTQILSVLEYLLFYLSYQNPTIENNMMHQSIMKDTTLEKTIVLDNVQELDRKIYDIEKDKI